MIKKVFMVIGILLAVFLVVVAMQPEDFSISRSTAVNAEPMTVFNNVNDFHVWEKWSPWAKLDAEMKTTYEGPSSGEGANYAWVGNTQVGEGKMTITKSDAPNLILIDLQFIKPMAANNVTEFKFVPEGSGTLVTWTMSGKNNFLAKAFHLFYDMDKLVGPDFEKGLADLKAVSEGTL